MGEMSLLFLKKVFYPKNGGDGGAGERGLLVHMPGIDTVYTVTQAA